MSAPRVFRPITAAVCLAIAMLLSAPATAQDVHLLVVAGVGGDQEHVAQFNTWSIAALDAAKTQGVPDANAIYLGDSVELGGARMKGRATRENVTKAFADMAMRAKPDDQIFVLLIGHGSFDGRAAAFNLPGPDLTVSEYAGLLDRFKTQRISFVNTASSSGGFTELLKGPGRTIVTATRTGGERNETRFPQYFVEALSAETADRDRNGRVSVLEAFDFAAAKVKASYEQGGHILTEHATLDDGSEGKLASTQYLAVERSRTAAAQSAAPALRALLEQRDTLERQMNDLRLHKDGMPAEQYDQQLERLATELALKTRAIRELETPQ